MAQAPYKVDQLQIEPGTAGTRLVNADADGKLRFQDPDITLTLKQAAGLQTFTNVFLVGTASAAADYTTIQGALDEVPITSSKSAPTLILVMPGVYSENLSLFRDGVVIMGLGEVLIRSLTDATPNTSPNHTLTFQANLGTIPRFAKVCNVTIRNSHDSYACVRVTGADQSTLADGGITFENVVFEPNASGGNFPVRASSVNFLTFKECDFSRKPLSLNLFEEVAGLTIVNCLGLQSCQIRWDSAQDVPVETPTRYLISNCPEWGAEAIVSPTLALTLGAGPTMEITSLTLQGDLVYTGPGALTVNNVTQIGDLNVSGSGSVKLYNTQRIGSVSHSGTVTIWEPRIRGEATFAADTSVAVTLPYNQPDTNYFVQLEIPGTTGGEVPWISGQSITGFTINFDTAKTMTIPWMVVR